MSLKTFEGKPMDDYVEVKFNPPRAFKQAGKSFLLTADGEQDLFVPSADTVLVKSDDGVRVSSAKIPRWIAEDRGLVGSAVAEVDEMTRYDWYLLGSAMALIIQGNDTTDAVWNAEKLTRKLLEQAGDD